MEKKTIAEFFDKCAPWWDADMIRNEDIISTILTCGGVRPGVDVLDVACGTGVLFPDYLSRGAASVTGIDISPEMAKIASAKFPEVQVICGDVEETEFDRRFDCIMVYNALPHFPDPKRLISVLAGLCKPGGRLSVAHGMSRDALTAHHSGRASNVSIDLLHEQELAAIFGRWFDVDVVISTDRMYQVSGVRKQERTERPLREEATSEETLALMKFMVSHNDAHTQELYDLAVSLKESGKIHTGEKLMDIVTDFDTVNARLAAVVEEL